MPVTKKAKSTKTETKPKSGGTSNSPNKTKASSVSKTNNKPSATRTKSDLGKDTAAKAAPNTPAKPKPRTATAKNTAKAILKPAVEKAPAPRPNAGRRSDKLRERPLTEAEIRSASESDYMDENQLHFFRERLMQMRKEVLARELDVKERLHQREIFADPADRASAEEEHWLDLRLRERESLLLRKIEDALRRIRDREYGYCEKTGEPIGIARLLARPTATVCVDIKGQSERAESQYRDR